MATTLDDLNDLINDRRRDSSSNSIDMTEEGFRAINSTLDIWNSLHDWPWTIKDENFNYNQGISKYPIADIASDFKSVVTLKPYKGSQTTEFWMVSENKFDSAVTKPFRFAVANDNGKQYLRVKGNLGNKAQIETATDVDNNGTWVGAGGISDVVVDNYEGFEWPTSIKFTFTGTTGTLTNSTFNAVDLQAFKDRSNLYFRTDISDVTNLTSFALKWGSDSSNYYTATATTNYVGESFETGWNIVKLAWDNVTTVGTPDDANIDYLQLTPTYSSDPGGIIIRVQDFFVSENVPLTLKYYTRNMVYDVSGSAQLQKFNDSAATTDYPLWSGQWDAVTEAFINSVLEIIFWMTGEYNDMSVAKDKITKIVEPVKARYPSQKRHPALFITTDTNL